MSLEKFRSSVFKRKYIPEIYDSMSSSIYHFSELIRLAGIESGNKVLDVGCGTAPHLDDKDRPYEYVGLDMSEKMLEEAKGKNGTFIQGDARYLPFERDTFDAVVSYNLLQHIDTEGAIEEMTRVLKPGKKLIATTNPPTSRKIEDLLQKLGFFDIENIRPKMPSGLEILKQFAKAGKYAMGEMLEEGKGELEFPQLPEEIIEKVMGKIKESDQVKELPLPYVRGTKP